ncbi:MAG: hypothetical protein IT370_04485 [Deltaproteobacteria bacterium]|nr:hypothetical protein [Deltaproteobacteria bacterium]
MGRQHTHQQSHAGDRAHDHQRGPRAAVPGKRTLTDSLSRAGAALPWVLVRGLRNAVHTSQLEHDHLTTQHAARAALELAREQVAQHHAEALPLLHELLDQLAVHRYAGQQLAEPPPKPSEPFAALARLGHELDRVIELSGALLRIVGHARAERRKAAALAITEHSARPVDLRYLRAALTTHVWPVSGTLWSHLHDAQNSSEEPVASVEASAATRATAHGAWTQPAPRQFKLHIRSFAPFAHFGGGFRGDDRGFSTRRDNPAVTTSRLRKTISFDLVTGLAHHNEAQSDDSHADGPFARSISMTSRQNPFGAPPNAKAGASGDSLRSQHHGDTLDLTQKMAASNPLVLLAPDIDLDTTFHLQATDHGTLLVKGHMAGDGFPNAEVLLEDATGTMVLIHGFATNKGSFAGPTLALWGDDTYSMGSFEVELTVDAAGHVTGVLQRGGQISTARFNQRGEGRRRPTARMIDRKMRQEIDEGDPTYENLMNGGILGDEVEEDPR